MLSARDRLIEEFILVDRRSGEPISRYVCGPSGKDFYDPARQVGQPTRFRRFELDDAQDALSRSGVPLAAQLAVSVGG